MAKTVVYIIDDDAAMRDSLAFLLDVNGFQPEAFESANSFLGKALSNAPACVVSDIRMAGMNGIDLVRKLKEVTAPPR